EKSRILFIPSVQGFRGLAQSGQQAPHHTFARRDACGPRKAPEKESQEGAVPEREGARRDACGPRKAPEKESQEGIPGRDPRRKNSMAWALVGGFDPGRVPQIR